MRRKTICVGYISFTSDPNSTAEQDADAAFELFKNNSKYNKDKEYIVEYIDSTNEHLIFELIC